MNDYDGRCFYGFIKNRKIKVTSIIESLDIIKFGDKIINFCKSLSLKELNDIYDKIVLVTSSGIPSFENVKIYFDYAKDIKQSNVSWGNLLFKSIGNIDFFKDPTLKHMISKEYLYSQKRVIKKDDYPSSSDNIRFEYIIDLDNNELIFRDRFSNKTLQFSFNELENIKLEDEIKKINISVKDKLNEIKELEDENVIENFIDHFKEVLEYKIEDMFTEKYITEIKNFKISFDLEISDLGSNLLHTFNYNFDIYD